MIETIRSSTNSASIALIGIVICVASIGLVALPLAIATPHGHDEPVPPLAYALASLGGGERLMVSLPPQSVPLPRPDHPGDTLHSRVSTACLPEALKGWLLKVQQACAGFTVISANRPGSIVRGSRRTSLHASCAAADFQVNSYPCAQRVLKDFPGGLSTDPGVVHHLHASMKRNSREWGSRFAHWQPKRRAAVKT
jgi:hypothetical protein